MIPLELDEGEQLLLVTSTSVWVVRTRRFHRSPRVRWVEGRPVPQRDPVEGDGRWHPHAGASWVLDVVGMRLRLDRLPVRPPAAAPGAVDAGCPLSTGDAERVLVLPVPQGRRRQLG